MKRRILSLRPLRTLVAVVVGTLTVAVFAQAVQTITTANAAIYSYSLAPGGNSVAITPVANQSVLVMGVQTAVGYRGVGHVSMLRVPSSFLEWSGVESPTPAAIASGFSGTPGTHIVWLDYSHTVDIRVNSTDTFVVHNGNGSTTMTGNVTLIW